MVALIFCQTRGAAMATRHFLPTPRPTPPAAELAGRSGGATLLLERQQRADAVRASPRSGGAGDRGRPGPAARETGAPAGIREIGALWRPRERPGVWRVVREIGRSGAGWLAALLAAVPPTPRSAQPGRQLLIVAVLVAAGSRTAEPAVPGHAA